MHERILIGGLDSAADAPKNYQRLQRRHGTPDDEVPFSQVVDHLHNNYGIEWRDLGYIADPDESVSSAVSWEEVNHYRALVNPAWVGRDESELPDDRQDAIWHIPTKKYTKATPSQLWDPLVTAFRRKGYDSDLFGTVRVRRQGGEIHMDVFVKGLGLGTDDEITLGIQTGHDYFGNTRLYVGIVAYHDTGDGVGQIMRYLVDPKRRKHTGEAGDEVVDWYESSIERLEDVTETLYEVVAEAMHYEVPLKDIPCSISGFYEHLGLPNRGESTLADPAGERAVETAVGPYTAWHMYKAGMWAIEHEYDSRDTSSFKKHVSTVNQLLFNPKRAEMEVIESCKEDLRSSDEDAEVFDFVDDDHESTFESMETRLMSISEGVEEFESTRERVRAVLNDEGVLEADS